MRASEEPFARPAPEETGERLPLVLHTLYLLFNEGYATSSGPNLTRTDLSGEAIRLVRQVHAALPEEQEVAALLALMVLTDARREARTDDQGHLVPLADQDRSRWDRQLMTEGMSLVTDVLGGGPIGEYVAQAAIAAVHAEAADAATTDWAQIRRLYDVLEALSPNPMVTLNRAVAVAMSPGPGDGLAVLDEIADRLGDHHRFHAVRAHLLDMAGRRREAAEAYRQGADGATNAREQHHLLTQAARLGPHGDRRAGPTH